MKMLNLKVYKIWGMFVILVIAAGLFGILFAGCGGINERHPQFSVSIIDSNEVNGVESFSVRNRINNATLSGEVYIDAGSWLVLEWTPSRNFNMWVRVNGVTHDQKQSPMEIQLNYDIVIDFHVEENTHGVVTIVDHTDGLADIIVIYQGKRITDHVFNTHWGYYFTIKAVLHEPVEGTRVVAADFWDTSDALWLNPDETLYKERKMFAGTRTLNIHLQHLVSTENDDGGFTEEMWDAVEMGARGAHNWIHRGIWIRHGGEIFVNVDREQDFPVTVEGITAISESEYLIVVTNPTSVSVRAITHDVRVEWQGFSLDATFNGVTRNWGVFDEYRVITILSGRDIVLRPQYFAGRIFNVIGATEKVVEGERFVFESVITEDKIITVTMTHAEIVIVSFERFADTLGNGWWFGAPNLRVVASGPWVHVNQPRYFSNTLNIEVFVGYPILISMVGLLPGYILVIDVGHWLTDNPGEMRVVPTGYMTIGFGIHNKGMDGDEPRVSMVRAIDEMVLGMQPGMALSTLLPLPIVSIQGRHFVTEVDLGIWENYSRWDGSPVGTVERTIESNGALWEMASNPAWIRPLEPGTFVFNFVITLCKIRLAYYGVTVDSDIVISTSHTLVVHAPN